MWQLQMLTRLWVSMDSLVEYVSARSIFASYRLEVRVLIHNEEGCLLYKFCGLGNGHRWCRGSFGDILGGGGFTRYLNPGF